MDGQMKHFFIPTLLVTVCCVALSLQSSEKKYGIAACPLTAQCATIAQLIFELNPDFIETKTFSANERIAYPYPHIVFIDNETQITEKDLDKTFYTTDKWKTFNGDI